MKKEKTTEQKKLDMDLWIIAITTMLAYVAYGFIGSDLMAYAKNSDINVWKRLFAAAFMEFAIAGLGITLVCIIRKESFISHGLKRENLLKAILGAVVCFIPLVLYIVLSGQFEGYEPLSIMVTEDLHNAGILTAIAGTLVIAIVWGFFEGFNYAMISEIIAKRYPVKSRLFDWGALVCAIMGILFHPMSFDLLGIIEIIVTFIALYGMLIIRKHTDNSWGCVFAFIFIWNAI